MGVNPAPPVLILHQRVGESSLASDAGVLDEVRAVGAALDELGRPHRVAAVGSIEEAARAAASGREHLIFNLVESFERRPATAVSVPAVCEALGRECTGSDTFSLGLTLDKALTRAVLEMAGVPVPAGVRVELGGSVPTMLPPGSVDRQARLTPTLARGSGPERSVVETPGAVMDAVTELHRRFQQPALIEQLVGSRELNVSVLEENGQPVVLPVAEIDFSAFVATRPRIVDYAAKWETDSFEYNNTPRIVPADLPRKMAQRVRDLAVVAWRAAGCRDYARVDFRLDVGGQLFVLEVNANPDISPDAGFAAALEAAGRSYASFVELVLGNAQRRLKEREVGVPQTAIEARKPKTTIVRATEPGDRDALMEIVRHTANFRPDEIVIAEEVLDDSIHRPGESGYVSLTALDGDRPVGWVCYGATPCTLGTYDIYWIVVDAEARRGGWGTELMREAEAGIEAAGGRLVVLDTSGNDAYIPTRSFYSRLGYREAARIADFYAPGDDKVIFAKDSPEHT